MLTLLFSVSLLCLCVHLFISSLCRFLIPQSYWLSLYLFDLYFVFFDLVSVSTSYTNVGSLVAALKGTNFKTKGFVFK